MTDSPSPPDGRLLLDILLRPDPTVIGLVDLDHGVEASIVSPDALPYGDQILLVRLHGEPVGLVAVDSAPGSVSPDELAAAIWRQASERIIAHTQRCGCVPVPSAAQALLDGFSDACTGRQEPQPAGRASVIVPTVGRPVLERTIAGLLKMEGVDFEIVIVDNRPATSGLRERIRPFTEQGRVRYVAEPRRGVACARNAGLLAVRDATFVAFTDDDVVVDPDWLRALLAPFSDPDVDAVTGLVMPVELATPAQKRFELYAGLYKILDPARYDMVSNRADHRLLYPYWGNILGCGSSMAFRRSALAGVGGFDPALGSGMPTGGGEDSAALTDIVLAGGVLVQEPRALSWHEHRRDEAALQSQVYEWGIGFTANLWKYASSDPHFFASAVRSVPILAHVLVNRQKQRESAELPSDLSRLEMRGRLLGPWCYEKSRHLARRMGAMDVVAELRRSG